MQETSQGGFTPHARGVLGQHEENGLESVLSVLRMAQDAAAHAQHHRAVTLHEYGESVLVAVMEECRQQLLIAVVAPLPRGQLAVKSAKPLGQRGTTHDTDSKGERVVTV